MTTQLDYAERCRRFHTRVHAFIAHSLIRLAASDPELGARVIEAYHADRVRLMTEVDLTDDESTATDLTYRVDLFADDEWGALCRIHWSLLMDDPADAVEEMRLSMLQNGVGIPDDPSELIEPLT
jgi:hypothetical protein